MIRSRKNVWMAILFLIIFLTIFPNQILSKTTKASKSPKASPKAKTSEKAETSQAIQATSGGLQCDAESAVLMDGLTGQVLYEQNPNLKIPPASFVKVMTLYLVYDAIRAGQVKIDDLVTVSERAWKRAWKTDSSKMFIKVGERVKVEDLMKGVAIASGNDACVALAEHLSGSEEAFVSKMNEKAKLLGLNDTQFKNSDGMPADGQHITAMDMANLSRRYIADHPEALVLHSTVEFEYNGIRQGNRNTLLQKNIGVDGLKTGHIRESGYHLAATAKRDGQKMEYYNLTGKAMARLTWTKMNTTDTTAIVDDGDLGFETGGTASGWRTAYYGYGGRLRWTDNRAGFWARWTPALPRPAHYEVWVYIPGGTNRTSSAHYYLRHEGEVVEFKIDQRAKAGQWVSLGKSTFNANNTEFVHLDAVTGEPACTRTVGFDAVKFVYRGP